MKCTACGNENSEDAQFCGICSVSLTSEETSIGTELPMVSFGEAISRGFRNYFNFNGRATKAEFWWWFLFSTIGFHAMFFPSMIGAIINGGELIMFLVFVGWVYPITFFVFGIPMISSGSRRLHDTGRSGWRWLLFMVPFGFIFLIVWWCQKGNAGPNKYGPDPRQATSQQPYATSTES